MATLEPEATTTKLPDVSHIELDNPENFNMAREDLRMVYQATMASRIDFRTRIWETIKTAALLSTGMLAGVGGIVASGISPHEYYILLGCVDISTQPN